MHGRLGVELDENIAAQLKTSNTFLVPNLGIGELRNERVADDPFLQETLHPLTVEHLAAGFDRRPAAPPNPQREMQMQAAMQVLLDAGVDVVLGTDAGAVPDHLFGYTGHRELEIFVRLGMTPMQAIIAATSAPARHLGLDESGMLAPGMRADFVVFDADPTVDISNSRTISAVYLGGKQVDRGALRQQWSGTSP